ncbi:hypothetical protein C0J52_16117 [Blattella germanica]|nr:hypothetical protein C0J52_16117 [Blattella germanica]
MVQNYGVVIKTINLNYSIQKEIKHKLNSGNAFILYGCETWTLTLREEKRLRVFENKVLWKILRWAGHNNINHDLTEDRDIWRAYVRTARNLRVR